MKRRLTVLLLILVTGAVLYGNGLIENSQGWPIYDSLVRNAAAETGSLNLVTAIYLNYRYYDTLFEAIMLLFSILAVIFMSVHEGGEGYE